MKKWDVERTEYLDDRYFELLDQGWEPYSVTEDKVGYSFFTYCYFRKHMEDNEPNPTP